MSGSVRTRAVEDQRALPLPSCQSSIWGIVHLGSASACWVSGTDADSFRLREGGLTRSHSSPYGISTLFHRRLSTARWKEGITLKSESVCFVLNCGYLHSTLKKTNVMWGSVWDYSIITVWLH